MVAALFVVWYVLRVFLLAFAGILLAVFLEGLGAWLSRWARLPYRWSLALVVAALVVLFALAGWLIGARLSIQVGQLGQQLPSSIRQVHEQLMASPWGRWLVSRITEGPSISGTDVIAQVTGLASGVVEAVAGVVVILFVGLYGAAQPEWYIGGVLRLVPLSGRKRAEEVLQRLGFTLRWWLFGQVLAMVTIGVATGLGLWLVGSELPLALGLLAFGLESVPTVGPILAAIPAVLLAWMHGLREAVCVVLLYLGIHALEAYIVAPLVQLRTIHLPPAIQVLAVLSMGLLAGVAGILVATPLVISLIVLVQMLYVEDVLGDRAAPG